MRVLCFVSASCLISLCLFCKSLCLYTNWCTYQIVKFNLYYVYTNSFIFIFVDVNVDDEYAIHSDVVISNNFINYKVLPASNFHFIGLESSQLLRTVLTPQRKYSNDYCFSLALSIFPIMFARLFPINKHQRINFLDVSYLCWA